MSDKERPNNLLSWRVWLRALVIAALTLIAICVFYNLVVLINFRA